ncbi:MAG: hypothetical protein K5694_02865 [Bacilli bacterium]|nr:hypothetical protein [Bacilli bacterium]
MKSLSKIVVLTAIAAISTACAPTDNDKKFFHYVDVEHVTFYNDKYFLLDNETFHEEFALASAALQLAHWYPYTSGDKTSYLTDIYSKFGFTNCYYNKDLLNQPGLDTIGLAMASKAITLNNETFTVISINPRGTLYDGEWASNVTMGKEGNAQGFNEAGAIVIGEIGKYIEEKRITGDVKLWFSGYSRSAIVSNLAAAAMLEDDVISSYSQKNVIYDEDDVYAYCIECPAGASSKDYDLSANKYRGIHNILNFNDPVPMVNPYILGFARFGTDYYFPDRLTDIHSDEKHRESMVSHYHFLHQSMWDNGDYPIDDWKFFDPGESAALKHNLPIKSVNPSLGRTLSSMINKIICQGTGEVKVTREIFADKIQVGLRNIFAALYGIDEDFISVDSSKLLSLFFEGTIIKRIMNDIYSENTSNFLMDSQSLFTVLFKTKDGSIGPILNKLYSKNTALLGYLCGAFCVRTDIAVQVLYRPNLANIYFPHNSTLIYSLICTADSRLYGEGATPYNDGSYYILSVSNPSKFEIYEDTLNKRIFHSDGSDLSSDCVSGEMLADGTLQIYLPKNGKYHLSGEYDEASLYTCDHKNEASILRDGITGNFDLI